MAALLLLVLLTQLLSLATAWMATDSLRSPAASHWRVQRKSSSTQLHYINEGEPSDADLIRQTQAQARTIHQHEGKLVEESSSSIRKSCRASLEGVSLAPDGFWAMLRITQDGYVPWRITDDPADAKAATSPEALTMIQLLGGVDLAGAILPPEVLARIVVLECERIVLVTEIENGNTEKENMRNTVLNEDSKSQFHVAQTILRNVQGSLPNATIPYSQSHEWSQARAKLPMTSLDEVTCTRQTSGSSSAVTSNSLDSFTWTCQIQNMGSLTLIPTLDTVESVLFQFSPKTSLAFVSLALGLRYQAPITVVLFDDGNEIASNGDDEDDDGLLHETSPAAAPVESSGVVTTLEALQARFPMYKTRHSLQKRSTRVQENIVRGFEIHKLTGALKVATKLGDTAAAVKIRLALDEYDSMDDLPTLGGGNGGGIVEEEDGEGLDTLQ